MHERKDRNLKCKDGQLVIVSENQRAGSVEIHTGRKVQTPTKHSPEKRLRYGRCEAHRKIDTNTGTTSSTRDTFMTQNLHIYLLPPRCHAHLTALTLHHVHHIS